ncbi:MAG: hypothetical protein LAO30_26070, partial [Acidobacteriia bacterium]|nr:hypothetical protein [Terriglobia bacterium]
MSLSNKFAYAGKVLPSATARALTAPVRGPVHLIIALADHFEPAIDPRDGQKRVPRSEQERRLEWWAREYPKVVDGLRDRDGRPLVHTYFYPAEQYDEGLLDMLAEHCHAGWGEVEIHLHHGFSHPDTVENTRRVLTEFRDRLVFRHRCLAAEEGSTKPAYAFVHGNFALANSAAGRFCGVDSELQILAETGCYVDLTMPSSVWHPAQIARTNSLYECALPLDRPVPHRLGNDLVVGRRPETFPVMVQGPLLTDVRRSLRSARPVLENGAITGANPPTMHRFSLWKQAQIRVLGRPDWLFVKVFCHSMNPTQKDAVIGDSFRNFLATLVGGAADRKETLHFVTAREMANILFAACDGR